MKCTACRQGTLQPSFMDSLFRAHTCDYCGGNWVFIEDFLAWREQNSEYDFAQNFRLEEDVEETSRALLCPVTGAIMTKFRISTNTHHRVDYSASVGGVWLDKGEWQLLKKEGVAGHLSSIVTQSWQDDVRRQGTKESFEAIYLSRFGEEDYKKAKALREWFQAHPKKADLRCYIFIDDPYS